MSEAFAKGDSIQQMAQDGKLHPVMPGLVGYTTMYLHQQEVFEAVQAGRHVLVSTGTGSGKTEAFLYPILDDLLRERDGMVVGSSSVVVGESPSLALSAETPAFVESATRCQQPSSGLTAILVYPMNALANDQLDRLREMLAGTGITFGQWVGPTPDTEAKVTIERFESSGSLEWTSGR